MVSALICNLILATDQSIYFYLLLLQFLFYFFAYLGWKIKESKNALVKSLQLITFFVSMNFSLMRGFVKFLNKNLTATWESTSR
jgi:hypothetical protein